MLFRHRTSVPLFINLDAVHYEAETMVRTAIEAGAPSPESVYDFFIDALGRELEATYSCSTLNCGVDALKYFEFPSDAESNGPTQVSEIHITNENVICIPWHRKRLFDALGDIRENGYNRLENSNCGKGLYYPELKLVIVTTAHHHIAAARAYHDQNIPIKAAVVSLEPMFQDLRVSPTLQWKPCRPTIERLTPDPRFCLMYEFARRKALLLKSLSDFRSEPETRISFFTTLQVVPIEHAALPLWQKVLLRCTDLYIEPNTLYRQKK